MLKPSEFKGSMKVKCVSIICINVTNSDMRVCVDILTQQTSTVLEVGGAEGLVRDMIS